MAQTRCEGGRSLVLQLDHSTRRARLIQQLFQEQRHPPLALLETAPQQGGQRDPSRSSRTWGHAHRKLAAGAGQAIATGQPVQLLFRHHRLDLRKLPDLMPQWLRVGVGKSCATPAATLGFLGNDRLTLIARNQGSLMLRMSGLTAGLVAALFPRTRWFRMRLRGTWRPGRIAR